MVLVVILIYGAIGFLEIYPMVNKKQTKELIVYSVFFLAAFIISLLMSLGVRIPSPADPIAAMVKAVIGK